MPYFSVVTTIRYCHGMWIHVPDGSWTRKRITMMHILLLSMHNKQSELHPRHRHSNNRIFRLGFYSNEETRKRKMTFYWLGGVPIVYCALTIIGYASLLCVSWSNCHLGRGFTCHGNIW
jgi:hypothetical protein